VSDAPPRPQDSVEQRLGIVARGVQRMADSFGSLEQRLQALSDRTERIESESARAMELLLSIGTTLEAALGAALDASPRDPRPLKVTAAEGERLVDIDRLEASLRDVAQDTSGLRADVRRSFDRVLHSITTAEESLTGEVRAIDHRLGGMGDDLRLVRGMRDGLEALSSGIDSVRQLAARSATSSQMGDLAHDLSTVLAEIETARAHVLSVDQQVGRAQADAIDVGAPPREMQRTVEKLERTVSDEIGDLGRRIEALADTVIAAAPVSKPDQPPDVGDQIALRLKSLATSARQLGLGMAEELKARRAARPLKARGTRRR
jgi:hypothetical protein